jgi:hypothetical protein
MSDNKGFVTQKRNPPPSEEEAIRRIGAVLYGKQGEKMRCAVAELQKAQTINSLDVLIESLCGICAADIKKGTSSPENQRTWAEYFYIVYIAISQNRLVDRQSPDEKWQFNADLWAKVQERALINR